MTTKTPLLLQAGVSYAATTPLWYTLMLDHKYYHSGHRKEMQWLPLLDYKRRGKERSYQKRAKIFVNNPQAYKKKNKPQELQTAPDFSLAEEEYFFSLPTSIEKYIEYYELLWSRVKGEYQSVCDLSNFNIFLQEEFLQMHKDQLLEHFDIKVMMIFRDPIRRLWSSSLCDRKNMTWNGKVEYFARYVDIYKKYVNVFGKERVMPLIMEEIWEDPTPLSDFLAYKIEKMHVNCYHPERGTRAPKHKYLKDQWKDETLDIIEAEYYQLKDELSYLYTDFEQVFGRMPKNWGVYI